MRTKRFVRGDGQVIQIAIPKENKSAVDRRTRGEKILHTIVTVVLILHICTLFVPWLWTFMASLKGTWEYDTGYAFDLPKKWLFSNFLDAFLKLEVEGTTFLQMIWNSVWYVGLNATLDMFIPACTGYCLSKYDFKGKNIIYATAITCLTIPIVGSMASAFKIYQTLKIYDTPFYVIISSMGGFGGTFLIYYGYFKNISWSYAEATMMDGGGPFTIFFKVMLPQALPLMTTYAITGAIASWNDYMSFITYMPSWPNLATGLYYYQSDAQRYGGYPLFFAGSLISLIPTITIFVAFSSKIMTSLSIGGLKG